LGKYPVPGWSTFRCGRDKLNLFDASRTNAYFSRSGDLHVIENPGLHKRLVAAERF
jgi:hypothetical protein